MRHTASHEPGAGARLAGARDPARGWRRAAVGLLAITLLAGALRLYGLDRIPPGLHFDEAFNGWSAREMLEGGPLRIFFSGDMGEEPLHIYLVAAMLALFGYVPWAIRLASALTGTVTVALAGWLGCEAGHAFEREGGPRGDARAVGFGLGTALVLAILYWHLSLSRMGMEPITVPFTAVLGLAPLLHGLRTGRRWAWVLAGIGIGGSVYTYKAGYFVPLLAALFAACLAVARRDLLRRHGRGLLLAAAVAVLVAAPLGVYFAAHPYDLLHRPGDVVAGGEAGSPILANVPPVLGMFFLRGDADPRNNLPGRPALDPFLAVLFAAGLLRAAFGAVRGRPGAILAIGWLVVMTAPTLITVEAPHFRRAAGATPAVALLCAVGGWTIWELAGLVGARRPRYQAGADTGGAVPASLRTDSNVAARAARGAAALALAAGFVFSTARTVGDYFVRWGQGPDVFYAYDVALARVAAYANTLPEGEALYVTPTEREHYTLRFLLRRPYATFDGRAGRVYPPPEQAATVVVMVGEDRATLPALKRERRDGKVTWKSADPYGRPIATAYRLPAHGDPAPAPDRIAAATFGGAARLAGYSLAPADIGPGQPITLTLVWEALAPLPADYTVFAHLVGPPNPATGGPVWAGHDSQPDGGAYPTTAWRPGETILDVHRLAVPADLPPGEYEVEVGLYLLATLERLPGVGADGRPLRDQAAILDTLRIKGEARDAQ